MKLSRIIILSCFCLSSKIALAQGIDRNSFSKNFQSCWKVLDILHDDESIYSHEQLKAFSKKYLCFEKDTVRMFIDTLANPHYFFKQVNTKQFLWDNYQLDKDYFKIKADNLWLVKLTGTVISKKYKKQFPAEYELFYDGTYLILYQDMTVFRLYKPKESV